MYKTNKHKIGPATKAHNRNQRAIHVWWLLRIILFILPSFFLFLLNIFYAVGFYVIFSLSKVCNAYTKTRSILRLQRYLHKILLLVTSRRWRRKETGPVSGVILKLYHLLSASLVCLPARQAATAAKGNIQFP